LCHSLFQCASSFCLSHIFSFVCLYYYFNTTDTNKSTAKKSQFQRVIANPLILKDYFLWGNHLTPSTLAFCTHLKPIGLQPAMPCDKMPAWH